MIPIIICGGVGTKMWPESSPEHPKHFLPLIDGKSLFELNWEMLRKKFRAEEIFLQTNPEQAGMAMALVGEIKEANVLFEPEVRNTGPAIGLTAALLAKKGRGDEPFVLIQADVLRKPEEKLFEMMEVLADWAMKTDKYITGCIKPKGIVRGVDYLVKGKLIEEREGIKVYEVADYVDRSEEEKLQKYIGTDELMIHCNHTTMTPNNYLKMYQKHRKDWYEPLMEIVNGGEVDSSFRKMPKGMQEELTPLMHKSGQGIMVELPFEWIDFGTWESVAKYVGGDEKIEIGAKNNFVRSKKPVAIIGLDNLVVIESEGGLLVCPKSESGKVGEVVKQLK